jgi:cytochrome c oxidase subunit 2
MRLNFSATLAALAALVLAGTASAAQPEPWQLGLQAPATPVMEQLTSFHNLLLVIITGITLFVLGLLVYVMVRFNAKRNPTPSRTSHNSLIEFVWTVVPVLILLVIAFPSFMLLFYMNEEVDPELTVVTTGYQWYWGYEYPDQQIGEFTSFMIPDEEIDEEAGQQRLLSVDNPLVLPVDTRVQVLVTAGDVLHSFAIPAAGIKTDAVPGRMNSTWLEFREEGTYYGQCSELCGTGHAYMPIEIEVVGREAFDDWVMEQTAGLDLEQPPQLLTTTYEEAVEARRMAAAATARDDR